jgi:hypothetical protein
VKKSEIVVVFAVVFRMIRPIKSRPFQAILGLPMKF